MSKELMRAIIDSNLPPGPLWVPEEDSDLDKLFDAFAGNSERIRLFIYALGDLRNPFKTTELENLEREFGVLTDYRLTEETRRLQLAAIMYVSLGTAADDDLQKTLNDAGFDVFVYQNSPAVDPALFFDQAFQMVAGGDNAYAGRADAFAGRLGGELLVNGEFYQSIPDFEVVAGNAYAGDGSVAGYFNDIRVEEFNYVLPTDPNTWPFIFFVGGDVTREFWDLATAAYINKSFYVGSEDTLPRDIVLKTDGTKMYIIGASNGKIYQYTLGTAWDISTASYDSVNLDISTEDTNPTEIFIKSDGSTLWMLGENTKAVYQYTFGTPWDLSTLSYDAVSFSVASEDAAPRGLNFRDNGTKMYITGAGGDKVYQYSLGTAWDISTAVYDNVSLDTSTEDITTTGISFKPDGTRFYLTGAVTKKIYQYSLGTAWDISTASYDEVNIDISAQTPFPRGLTFKTDGSYMYTIGQTSDSVFQYELDSSNGKILAIASAYVPSEREQLFKRLILRKKPLYTWATLVVTYV